MKINTVFWRKPFDMVLWLTITLQLLTFVQTQYNHFSPFHQVAYAPFHHFPFKSFAPPPYYPKTFSLYPRHAPMMEQVQSNFGQPIRNFNETTSSSRDHRLLSLFTVVQFSKETCTSISGDIGVCLTPPDCLSQAGIPSGPCAKNFGICCVKMATCGQEIRENGTYFVNRGYPGGYNSSGSCRISLNKMNDDICQFRIDFHQFSVAGPEPTHHVCNYDQLIITGSSSDVPSICGFNSGQHMYIDAGNTNPVILSVITNGPEFTRYWKIRILQISCSSPHKADDGCLQYYSSISGTMKSFNYEPVIGLQLSNQDYTICLRSERNFCGIQYSQCADSANNRTHSFTLSGNTWGQNAAESAMGSTGTNACNSDWLMIPCAYNTGSSKGSTCVDRVCGGTLNTEITTVPSFIYSSVKPFRLTFHTNNIESPDDMGNRGFCLNYIQKPCTNNIFASV